MAVLAQRDINLTDVQDPFKPITDITVPRLVKVALNLALITAALVSFAFLLFGGIQWILAGGDKEQTEKARKRITNSLIGLAIVFSAYALALLIKAVFGVDILSLTIPQV